MGKHNHKQEPSANKESDKDYPLRKNASGAAFKKAIPDIIKGTGTNEKQCEVILGKLKGWEAPITVKVKGKCAPNKYVLKITPFNDTTKPNVNYGYKVYEGKMVIASGYVREHEHNLWQFDESKDCDPEGSAPMDGSDMNNQLVAAYKQAYAKVENLIQTLSKHHHSDIKFDGGFSETMFDRTHLVAVECEARVIVSGGKLYKVRINLDDPKQGENGPAGPHVRLYGA